MGCQPLRAELTLVVGSELAVGGVVFEVEEKAIAVLGDRLESLGIAVDRVDDDGLGGHGLRFGQPDGVPIECRVPRQGEPSSVDVSSVRPRRLGHVNLTMPSPPHAMEFFRDTLGLKLTEQLGEMLFFLRINSDHHNITLPPG